MANGIATTGLLAGVIRVFEAGERLLVDQTELVRLESRERIASFAARVGFAVAAALFLFTAWIGAFVAAIVALDTLPLAARIALAALVQLVVGIALLLVARRGKGDIDATH
ncbi:MAG TPA: phage holin family protein [Myxococcota bacterium]|nr:phage holin family protein [Myxococcota bacterium]